MAARNGTLRALGGGLVAALLGTAGVASAEPIAFSTNEAASSVSVIDASGGTVFATISVSDNFLREPRDVAIDAQSGRVFVAGDGQLISFDGRQPDGRGMNRVWARADGASLAIDGIGRRVFMAHRDPGLGYGVVSEYSIANPAAPTLTAERAVAGLNDLDLVAWDGAYQRLYVVEDHGRIARTGPNDMNFAQITDRQEGPGGILVDPAGGVWVSIRSSNNGKLVRIEENGTVTPFVLIGHAQPRGLAWDTAVPGTILVAIDATPGRVLRFTPSTGAFVQAMSTDARTQDVAVTASGAKLSVNRVASSGPGSMTEDGALLASTGDKPVALALTELPRLTVDPPAKTFCYNTLGDSDEQTFSVQNTRIDRLSIDLLPVAIGGANPANYQLVGTNTCSSARLQWGQSCSFRVRFTASGPSAEPPPRFGKLTVATWPAEVVVAGTGGSATARIPVRGGLSARACYPLPSPIQLPTRPILFP